MTEDPRPTDRMSPGGFSITLFIGSTIYLGLVNNGWQTLLTLKTALFVVLGIFFSVLLIGVPFHLVRIWMEKRFFKTDGTTVLTAKAGQIKAVTTLLMVCQVVMTFYATKYAYAFYFS